MKNRNILIVILAFVSVYGLSASEVATVWARLYGRAQSLEQKYEIMLNMVEQHDRDLSPVLSEALSKLILEERNLTDQSERALNAELERIIIRELGSLKAVESAPAVMTVAKEAKDNFLRGEALTALGKMGAKEYAPDIALMLRNINSSITPIQNKQEEETVVKGCIFALERMKDPVGFEPVFFASIGRYSREIRLRAQDALLVIADDPSEMLAEIIEKDSSPEVKYEALLAAKRSKASPEGKNGVAVSALQASLLEADKDPIERIILRQMRIDALLLMRDSGVQSEENVQLITQMISGWKKYRLYTEDEMLA
ncbi:MAG TPA: PBS lyase, partial [Spirochaetia bacterium]|nr:PBS lyase [Spirochaetia bacterium]